MNFPRTSEPLPYVARTYQTTIIFEYFSAILPPWRMRTRECQRTPPVAPAQVMTCASAGRRDLW